MARWKYCRKWFLKDNNWAYGTKETAHQGLGGFLGAKGTVGMITFVTIMGGAGSALTGGNFWQGAVTGLIVSGLNHAMHDGDPAATSKDKPKFVGSERNTYLKDDGSLNLDAYNCHSYAWHNSKW
jgi:hypothetical protein